MLTLWKPNALRRTENGATDTRPRPTSTPTLFDELDRFFDRAFEDMALPAIGWSDHRILALAADVSETVDEYRVSMDLPGLDQKDIEVKLEGETLTVRAERKTERRHDNETFLRSERSHGILQRSFVLPSSVDAAKVGATYRNGVLEITLPKREEAKPRAITIQVT